MSRFEGIMKLMTENSQEKTERSEVFTGCLRSSISLFPNKLNINTIIIRFPTYPFTNRWVGHPLLSIVYHFQWRQIFINATRKSEWDVFLLIIDIHVCVWGFVYSWELMRQKVTKIIRNVLLERAITGIGALSPCAIYPLNNIKRDIMWISYQIYS